MRLLSLVLLSALVAGPAFAADPAVRLYKVIGTKEDVVIGVTPAELRDMAGEADVRGPNDIAGKRTTMADSDLDTLGDRLVGVGHIRAWLYGPRRGNDGNQEWAPLRRILLFGAHVHRLETQTVSERVAPPPAN